MGTDLQEVFDAFFIKVPTVNFTGKESEVFQLFKTATSLAKKKTYDSLEYQYDDVEGEGTFIGMVSGDTLELLSMYMTKSYFQQKLALISGRKQHLGTQAFNKIPSNKEQFEMVENSLNYWNQEIEKLLEDFPDYSSER